MKDPIRIRTKTLKDQTISKLILKLNWISAVTVNNYWKINPIVDPEPNTRKKWLKAIFQCFFVVFKDIPVKFTGQIGVIGEIIIQNKSKMDVQGLTGTQYAEFKFQAKFWTEDCSFIGMQEQTVSNQSENTSAFLACSRLFQSFTEVARAECSLNSQVDHHSEDCIEQSKEQQVVRPAKRQFSGFYKKHYKHRKSSKSKLIRQMQALAL